MMRSIQRVFAAGLSAALVLLSPGFEAYAVAGNNARSTGGQTHTAPMVLPVVSLPANVSLGTIPNVNLGVPTINAGIGLPSISAPATTARSLNATAPVLPGIVLQNAQAQNVSAQNVAIPGAQSPIQTVRQAAQLVIEAIGGPQLQGNVAPSAAYGAGEQLESALTGANFGRKDDGSVPMVNAGSFGNGDGFFFAKPAGDSIREANDANNEGVEPQSGGPSVPTPPQNGGNGGSNRGPRGEAPRIPLVAKIVSAAVALVPVALLGLPLIAAGSTFLGAGVIAASAGYALFPFMSPSTPKMIRAIPGITVGLLGLTAVLLGISTGGLGFAAIGALTSFGGWGLIRWANKTDKYPDEAEVLLTMLGMLGAVAAVGLGAAPVAGVLAIVKIAGALSTLTLLTHLPGWIGDTLKNVFESLYRSARQAHRVATSIRRDTVLYKRLTNYSEAALEKSSWNILWLGLVVWLPLLVGEALQFVAGVAVGLVNGALQVPQVALWTITHHFAKDSGLNKRLAYGARLAARLSSKQGTFNAWEKPFLGWANDSSFIKRALGATAIRVAQLAWLISSPFVAAGVGLFGWLFAGAEAAKPYEPNLHSPDYLDVPRDTAGDAVPEIDKPKSAPGALPARIMASAIGFIPFVLLTLPGAVWGSGLLGLLMAATGISIALMPLIPAKNVPNWIAKAPGDFLLGAGFFTAFGAIRYMLLGLPTGPIIAVGVVALLAGFGLKNLVTKLRQDETKKIDTDDWTYALGYVGALGTVAALSIAMAGAGGLIASIIYWAGMASSLALLAHLPKYLWTALGDTFLSVFRSVGQTYKALGVWHRKTDFASNYMKWMGSMIKRWTVFVAPALLPLFIPILAVYLVQAAASLVLGLTLGLYHAPAFYAWSAAHDKNFKSKGTRFWSGFNSVFYEQLEGTRGSFLEPFVEKRKAAADDSASSGRPTLKAYGALFVIALATVAWLLRTAVALALTPVLVLWGIVRGIKRMGDAPAEDSWTDSPEKVFSR